MNLTKITRGTDSMESANRPMPLSPKDCIRFKATGTQPKRLQGYQHTDFTSLFHSGQGSQPCQNESTHPNEATVH